MKKILILIALSSFLFLGCQNKNTTTVEHKNILLSEWDTPYQVPPFDELSEEQYMPAFNEAIAQHNAELDQIINNEETATFLNTIEALETSGQILDKVSNVFYVLKGTMSNDSMKAIARKLSPILTKHRNDMVLNEKLFSRIKYVNENAPRKELQKEQSTLIDKYYEDFIKGGANLSADKKEKLREINIKLSEYTLAFTEHILNENNAFELVIEDKKDLAGLTDAVIQIASEAAEKKGYSGKWLFTIRRPSLYPFLTYSENRALRKKLYKGYINKGNNNDENDSKELVLKIAKLRLEKAKLFGYPTFAAYKLENKMAKKPENVYELLDELWTPALNMAKKEAKELQALIDAEGGDFKLKPWDWWYYTEKLKQKKFDFSEEETRPYFELERVRDGAFEIVNRIYGITFTERFDIPVYQEDVKVFEVKEADGTHIGLFFTDYYPRESKGMGAWMTSFRKQTNVNGDFVTPVILNVCNFPNPTKDEPSLITISQVETLFHELGHALHGLLSNSHYNRMSGTSVVRDFVELPSQIMENWVYEPEALKLFAKHYKTGEDMPQELLDKIIAAKQFNQGFRTVEYLAASFLDMDWHTLTEFNIEDPMAFENDVMAKLGMIPEIVVRYRSTYFGHTFSGGYSAGYYSYIWAEVLDADAFGAYEENGIFSREVGNRFRDSILSRGGTEDAMTLYKKFRGRKPKIDALLKKRGLIKS